MALKEQLKADMKTALRAGDKPRLGVVRMALAAIQQREVDERAEMSDAQVLATLEKMVKQRRESMEQYRAGGRDDLAGQEEAEIALLSTYLPEPLADSELDALIDQALAETGASSVRDMGKVMNLLRERVAGRADMAAVSARVKARLSA